LSNLDTLLFHFINQLELDQISDGLLILWRKEHTWIPLYIFLIGFLIYSYKKASIAIILFAILSVGFSDFTNSSLLKKAFERPRPCHTFEQSGEIILRVKCGRGFSFPSSHASNHMSLAIFLFFLFKRKRLVGGLFIFWALLVGFAQIYVGVHYPFDVLAGFLWGGVIGFTFYKLLTLLPNISTQKS